jgi:alpha-L-arabinofuranosidase
LSDEGVTVGGARVVVDPDFVIGQVDRRLFGSFVEHMGRCVYGGIYEPGHPAADGIGLRGDVVDLTRELGVTTVRYPGGNFVSGYSWEDGVGPVADRPTRLDLAWRSIETNAFGLHEFMQWAGRAEVDPILAVNLGTRGIRAAADLVEYANHPGGTTLSDQRSANGAEAPFGIRTWCLGNEMDGPWQVGQKTAEEYGRLAAEAGKAMKLVDPTIELVACGSSGRHMSTFGAWEREVLEHTYDVADYISLHAYYEEDDDLASFLASAVDMDAFISEVVATCDHVRAIRRSPKVMRLAFDEWNVWYQKAYNAAPQRAWERAPHLIEDDFTVADAVVVGSYLTTFLEHADRVAIACQAQLANIIAPIRTEPGGPAWRQSIFHPFALVAANARGVSLTVPVEAAEVPTARFGPVPAIQAAATWDQDTGRLAVFLVCRDVTEGVDVQVDVRSLPGVRLAEHLVITDPDLGAVNSAQDPDRVVPQPGKSSLNDGRLTAHLPPVSFHVLTLEGTTT